MPEYRYRCDFCHHCFDQVRGMSEPEPTKCQVCGRRTLQQDFSEHRVIGLVTGNPTTVGQQAEINAKRMGKERLQQQTERDYAKRKLRLPKGASRVERPTELPWYRSGEVPGLPKEEKPLDLTKIKDTKAYIETGNK